MASFSFGAGNAAKLARLPLYAGGRLATLVIPRRRDGEWVFGCAVGIADGALALWQVARDEGQRASLAGRHPPAGSGCRGSRHPVHPEALPARVLAHGACAGRGRDPRLRRCESLRRHRRVRRAAVARHPAQADRARLGRDAATAGGAGARHPVALRPSDARASRTAAQRVGSACFRQPRTSCGAVSSRRSACRISGFRSRASRASMSCRAERRQRAGRRRGS